MVHKRARHHYRHGKDEHRHEENEAYLLLHKVVGAEPLWHKPAHKHVAKQCRQHNIEQHKDRQAHNYRAAPLRVDLALAAVGGLNLLGVVLLADVGLGVVVRHRHCGQHLKVVLVAIDKDAVLYLVVSTKGIIVHLLELLRHTLVVLAVLDNRLAHLGKIAAQCRHVCQTSLAVGLTHSVEHERQAQRLAVLGLYKLWVGRFMERVLAHRLSVERGRNVAKRLHKILIALYLGVKTH